jgi:hypothetical protein
MFLAGATLGASPAAVPGTVNYVEGQVSLNGQQLTSKSIGSALVEPDQVLTTGNGRAEILLTPGVFLRVGERSAVRMVSPDLANTQVAVMSGKAMLEATEVFKDNRIQVVEDGAATRIEKNGLYEFDADQARVAVYDGQAQVWEGDKHVDLKKGHEALLSAALKAEKFDRDQHDQLYAWSNLRSEYTAEASMDAARTVVINNGFWGGPGWYWDPYWSMYSFVPGAGFLYSPFGWGFYSPAFIYSYGPRYFYNNRDNLRGVWPGARVQGNAALRSSVRGEAFAGNAFAGRSVGGGFGHMGGFGGRR